ncbi:tetratricopeptide repeat protein [Devosia sp.]|uniref:tetratricopeptide repeat protein n=1 Tax=Devosia sp. TaxID=1871048 RepID=UPI003BAA74B5
MTRSTRLPVTHWLGALLVAGCLAATPVLAVDSGGGNGGGSGGGGSSDGGGSSGGGGGSSSSSEASGPSLSDARAFIKASKWPQAIKVLKVIVAGSPNNADALNLLGYSLRKSGDMDHALGFYLKALKINPRHKGANEYLGELYVETGHMDKAKERLQVLAKLCGNTTCEEYEDLDKVIKAAS